MKILLLRPHSQVPAAPPPIGLMYLAGYLRQHRTQDQFEVFDARIKLAPPPEIEKILLRFQPDVVGITAFTMEAPEARSLAALVKKHFPRVPVVLGGPYPSSDPEGAGQVEDFDFLVLGEGEITFANLLNTLENGGDPAQIKGLLFRRNGGLIQTGPAQIAENPDDLPFPAWDLLDLEQYFHPSASKRRLTNPIQMRERGISVFTSRGCPYRCTYCHNIFGKKTRFRSPENVIAELKWLKSQFKVNEIEFIDDVFNLDLPRAKKIIDLMLAENLDLKFSFPNGLRADHMDEELILKMKAAGCYRINYAIESGSPRIQKIMRKNLKLPRAREIIDFTASQNISVGGFFMLGFPDETEEEMLMTIDFALKSKCHTASFFILTPFPGTEMYQEAIKVGVDMEAMYSDYGAVSKNLTRNVPSQKIKKLRTRAFRKFYFNPSRMWNILKTTPNKMALLRNFLRTTKLSFLGKEY